ncbi:MAG: hypothetical protein HEQ35_12415 [Gloeotrichia echinulata IR180]
MTIYERGIITFAYGLPKFIEMAKTLAHSLNLYSPNIRRAIVTDNPDNKELIELFDDIIPLRKDYGSNLRQKLHLDKYAPYQKTLYIDSDSIVVRDINFIFEVFAGRSFSLAGDNFISFGDKDPFFEVDAMLNQFALEKLPKFNGGLFYLEKGNTVTALFETSREILSKWREYGFSAWRGDGPNDEPIISIAMTLHGQSMVLDEGKIMRTPIGLRGSFDIDVLTGKSTFQKRDKVVSPAIVHFACVWNEHPVYYREVRKLKNLSEEKNGQINLELFSGIEQKFGYQIAFVKYVSQRILKIPKYSRATFKKVLKNLLP